MPHSGGADGRAIESRMRSPGHSWLCGFTMDLDFVSDILKILPRQPNAPSAFERRVCSMLPVFLLTSVLAACGGGDSVVCTAEVRAGVAISVMDSQGNPLAGATVSFTINGIAQAPIQCNEQTNGVAKPCQIGHETPGQYAILVELAGYSSASATVNVTQDVCHVITQSLTVTLLPPTE